MAELDRKVPMVQVPGNSAGNMTSEQLKDLLEAVKKPYKDPVIADRIARRRAQMRAIQKAATEARLAREAGCSHRRPDGTSAIAWMEGSGRWEPVGVCQHCNRFPIVPEDKDYLALRAIPDRVPGTLV